MKNKYIKLMTIVLPILLAVICIFLMIKNNNQANLSIPKEYVFTGEYSYDGENWYTYSEDCELSALEGDVIVKGHLDSEIPEGGILNFYCNHIGVSIYVNGEVVFISAQTEMQNYGMDLKPSMCGKRWEQLMCSEITAEDEIEIRFINYHEHENKNAYKEMLSSFLLTPPDNTVLEAYLNPRIEPFERTGYALFIVAVMLLGASLAALVFKSEMSKLLFKMGVATLFAAGYIVFDVMMLFYSDGLLVVNTYGRQLCLMLSIYFVGWLVCDALTDRYKKVAEIIMCGTGIINLFITALAIAGKVLLFDTVFFWEITQYVVSFGLVVLSVLEIIKDKKNTKTLVPYIGINIALIIDMIGVFESMYYTGMCYKVAYVIMLVLFLFFGVKQVVIDHHASIKNKKLKIQLRLKQKVLQIKELSLKINI